MNVPVRSSRRKYLKYRQELRERREKGSVHGRELPTPSVPESGQVGDPKKKKPRSRSFGRLFAEFSALLRGHRKTLIFILLALSISTLLGLAPLYGTKIVFDSVLRDDPLPVILPKWIKLPEG